MASLKAVAGSERVLQKLNRLLESEDFYEAHQLYRTINFRFSNAGRFEELAQLFLKGASLFLDKGQHNSGADLALLYVEAVKNDPNVTQKFSQECVKTQFAQDIVRLYSQIPPKTPERLNLVLSVMKLDEKCFPVPQIHHLIALQLQKEQNYSDARYHFLQSAVFNRPDAARMLIELQQQQGKPEEIDLFIAQFVLQALIRCKPSSIRKPDSAEEATSDPNSLDLSKVQPRCDEHRYAITVFLTYTGEHPQIKSTKSPFQLPMLNFIYLLLISIGSGNPVVFRALRQVYASSADRDETFRDYLGKIGELYFGLPVNRAGMSGIVNLLQQFMNGSDSEEETGNTNESQSSNVSSSASPQFSIPRRFVARSSENRSAARPRETQSNSEQQQFDLD